MARYIGPSTKIARKFGEPIYGTDKDFEKRNYPPGQHGLASKRKKKSEYGTQLKVSRKLSILTAFSKGSSATLTRKRPA